MRRRWVLVLGIAALAAAQGCKRKDPEPIPGPKAGLGTPLVHIPSIYGPLVRAPLGHGPLVHPPGIAWFQGSLDEAFARTEIRSKCRESRAAARAAELARARKKPSPPLPPPPSAICHDGACPPGPRSWHRLV